MALFLRFAIVLGCAIGAAFSVPLTRPPEVYAVTAVLLRPIEAPAAVVYGMLRGGL